MRKIWVNMKANHSGNDKGKHKGIKAMAAKLAEKQ